MTNSSDVASAAKLAALVQEKGFRPLAIYSAAPPAEPPSSDDPDRVEAARAQGYAQGHADGLSKAEAQTREALEARDSLSIAFTRLDREMEEQLRLALRETVIALCESALAPLAVDEDALLARIDRAVAMLSRSYDERTIRLHPDDLALVAERMREDCTVIPDPSLARGTLRVESTEGGIEDGPATWRRAIADALGPC